MPQDPRWVDVLVLAWAAATGACVGSFLNVCVYRLPRRCLSVRRPARSFCPACGRQLRWHENIPILSWLALRGRCAGCQGRIGLRYPLVEAATLLAFLALAWRDLAGRVVEPEAWGLFLAHATLVSSLLVCALVDLEFRVIPDEIDVPGILLAPLAVLAVPSLFAPSPPDVGALARAAWEVLESPLGWWGLPGAAQALDALGGLGTSHPEAARRLGALLGAVVGASVGAGFVYGTGVAFSRLVGQEAMGFGDVKLMGMLGAIVGWQGVVLTVLLACVLGSFGGVVHMVLSGRSTLVGRDLEDEGLTPLRRLALALTGARGPAGPEDPVAIRPGTGLFARFATGDPYVPFGPYLVAGGLVAAFWPEALHRLVALIAGR